MTLNNGIVKPGIDNLIENYLNAILKKKIALVANLASINHKIQSTIDILHNIIGNNLTAIFTPEHGLYGYKEYMVKVKSEFNSKLNIPIYSLYSNNLAPTEKMLKKIDTIIFDLQDIGVRYYTYASTLALCMEKCSILNKELIILDRPNPLSGNIIQGKILEKGYESFVGKLPIPVRHSLTIGELALLIKDYYKFNIELTVIPMQNWKRNMFWKDTDLYWIQPSPNMPHWETTIFYPGACLLEGTNISEGRGTTKPFEILGAPWIDHYELASFINNLKLPYISAIPIYFIPKSDKYYKKKCKGIQLCIKSPSADSYKAFIYIIHYIFNNYKNYFEWRKPPYEFEEFSLPFDLLNGTDKIRSLIEDNKTLRSEFPSVMPNPLNKGSAINLP